MAGSLQRKACIFLVASVTDDVEVTEARGVLVEALPDSDWPVALGTNVLHEDLSKGKVGVLAISPRNILKSLGLDGAEIKKTAQLSFACRCSPERALALISSMSKEERQTLPEKIDITCHMCGRTFTVAPGA